MKNLIYTIIALLLLSACGEDRTYEYLEITQENQWTFAKMNEVYLWSDSIKKPTRKEFFGNTGRFFSSILLKEDRFSYSTDSVTSAGYGFDFALMRDPLGKQNSKSYALVLFVEPGSPADVAGLKRGDWISKVGKNALNSGNYGYLERGGATTLYTARIVLDEESMLYVWQQGDTLQLPAASDIQPTALYLDSVYSMRGHNVGYMVCNRFAADSGEDIAAACERFAAKGVSELIVDLRYCSGGSIAVANSVASALFPQSSQGETFCRLSYNAYNSSMDTVYTLVPSRTLGLEKLFFICSESTRGAAEVLIASARTVLGYNNAIVIGEKSFGEYVMTEEYVSPYNFSISPAVAYVENDNFSLAYGVEPNYTLDELADFYSVYPLGSTQEYMLYNTLYLIVNGRMPAGEYAASSVTQLFGGVCRGKGLVK